MKKFLSLLLLLSFVALSLGGCEASRISTDPLALTGVLDAEGYLVQYYLPGDAMLDALASDMENGTKESLHGSIRSYLFAKNPESGAVDIEVFIFEKKADAETLYHYSLENSPFVEGQSECRISGVVVYMGTIPALDILERTAEL